jgi:hypothetical protein
MIPTRDSATTVFSVSNFRYVTVKFTSLGGGVKPEGAEPPCNPRSAGNESFWRITPHPSHNKRVNPAHFVRSKSEYLLYFQHDRASISFKCCVFNPVPHPLLSRLAVRPFLGLERRLPSALSEPIGPPCNPRWAGNESFLKIHTHPSHNKRLNLAHFVRSKIAHPVETKRDGVSISFKCCVFNEFAASPATPCPESPSFGPERASRPRLSNQITVCE